MIVALLSYNYNITIRVMQLCCGGKDRIVECASGTVLITDLA